jgi:hypothetical protein
MVLVWGRTNQGEPDFSKRVSEIKRGQGDTPTLGMKQRLVGLANIAGFFKAAEILKRNRL